MDQFKLKSPVTMYDEPKVKVLPSGKTLTVIGEIAVRNGKRKGTLETGQEVWFDSQKGFLEFENEDGQEFSLMVPTFMGKVEIIQGRRPTASVEVLPPAQAKSF